MNVMAKSKVDEIKDSILDAIATILTGEEVDHYANVGQLAAAYRQLADASS